MIHRTSFLLISGLSMRNFRYAVFSLILTVSFSLIASQAMARNNLGLLKQKNGWKIGTVNANDGTVYCAMVNRFSDDTILAFSRNQKSEDSIAIDFKNSLFTRGIKYLVSLGSDTKNKNNFSARANSDKSLVIELGRNSKFYSYFEHDRILTLSSSEVKAAFKLNKFYPSYAVLLDCAAGLNRGPKVSAVSVNDVKKIDLTRNKYKNLEKSMEDDFNKRQVLNSKKISRLNRKEKEILAKLNVKKRNVSKLKNMSNKQKENLIAALEAQGINANIFKNSRTDDAKIISYLKKKNLKKELLKQKEKVAILEKKYEESKNLKYNLKQSQKKRHELVLELAEQKQKIRYIKRAAELKHGNLSKLLNVLNKKISRLSYKYDEQRKYKDALNFAKQKRKEILNSLDVQKKIVTKLGVNNKGQNKNKLRLSKIKQGNLIEKLKVQEVNIKKLESAYEKQKNNNLKDINDLNIEKQKLFDVENSLKEQQDNILNALALNLKVESLSFDSVVGDSFDSKLNNILNKYKEQNTAKISKLKQQKESIMRDLLEQKQKVSNLELQYKDQRQAKGFLESEISARDDEIDRLKLSQKENLSLINELRNKKEQIIYQEKQVSAEQINLIKNLEEQQGKVKALAYKYNRQEISIVSLKEELRAKEKEIEEIKYDFNLKEDSQFNNSINNEKTLLSKVSGLKRKNKRLKIELSAVRKELFDAETEFNSESNGYISDRSLSKTLERQVKKSAELAQSFVVAKDVYNNKFKELQAERKKLQEKVEFLNLEKKGFISKKEDVEVKDSLNRKKIKELNIRMLSMAKQRDEMQERIDAQEMQNKLMEISLKAKEQELLSAKMAAKERGRNLENLNNAKTKQLKLVQSEILKLENNKDDVIRKLKLNLESRSAEYRELKEQFDKRIDVLPYSDRLMVEVERKEAELKRLERQLSNLEIKKIEALEKLSKAKSLLSTKDKKHYHSIVYLKTGKIEEIQSKYLNKLSKAKEERNKLQIDLDKILSKYTISEKKSLKAKISLEEVKKKLSEIEIKLAAAGQKRQEFSDMLEDEMGWDRDRIKSLELKEGQLLSVLASKPESVKDRKKLANVQFELSNIKASKMKSIGVTRNKLNKEIASYNALEKEFDRQSKIFPSANKIAKDIFSKTVEIKNLKTKLEQLEKQFKDESIKNSNTAKKLAEYNAEFLDSTNGDIKNAKKLVDYLSDIHTVSRSKIISLRRELSELKIRLANVVANKIPLITEKEKIKAELIISKNNIKSLEKDVDVAKKQKDEFASKLKEQDRKITSLENQVEDNNKAMPLNFKNASDLASKKEEIASLEKQLDNVNLQYKVALDEKSNLEEKISNITRKQSLNATGQAKKLADAQSELYNLKKKLSNMEVANTPVLFNKNRAEEQVKTIKNRLSSIEEELIYVGQEKMDLSMQLEDQNYKVSVLNDELANREDDLYAADDDLEALKQEVNESNDRFLSTRDEMDALKREYSEVVNDLVNQLNNKIAQYDGLKRQYDEEIRYAPSKQYMEENMNYIAQLEGQLDDVNSQRSMAINQARQAREDLERSRMQLESLKNGLKSGDEEFALMQESLVKQQRALENIIKEQKNVKVIDIRQKKSLSPLAIPAERLTRPDLSVVRNKIKNVQNNYTDNTRFNTHKAMPVPVPRERPKEEVKTLNRATDFLNKIMSYHRPGAVHQKITPFNSNSYSPEKSLKDVIGEPRIKPVENLKELLTSSGVGVKDFTPVEQTEYSIISQWNSNDGNISGMYEYKAKNGDFRSQVNNYIDRYRKDCDSGLSLRISPSQKTNAGTIITADMECNMPSNSYSNFVVFLENKEGFNSILHTGYPYDRNSVRKVRDKIVRNIKRIDSFSVPYSVAVQKTKKEYKFNIPASKNSKPTGGLETVIIQ